MTHPDDTEPLSVEYARLAEGHEQHVKLPARSWKALRISLTVAAICGVALLFGSDMILILAAFVGTLSSIVAVIAAVMTIGRNLDDRLPQAMRLSSQHCLIALVFAAALLGCYVISGGVIQQRFDEYIYSEMSAGNLRGIAQGVDMYHRDGGSWPATEHDLMTANYVMERNLVHPADGAAWQRMGTPQFVSSYVLLFPPHSARVRPQDILGYERLPSSIDGLRLFPKQIHNVVYMNGTNARLSATDLAAALAAQALSPTTRP